MATGHYADLMQMMTMRGPCDAMPRRAADVADDTRMVKDGSEVAGVAAPRSGIECAKKDSS